MHTDLVILDELGYLGGSKLDAKPGSILNTNQQNNAHG